MNKLELENIKKYKKEFEKGNYRLQQNSVQRSGVFNSAFNTFESFKLQPKFNVEVKDMSSVTNQKQSGRCWMFAGLNVIRPIIAKNLKVKDLELSESYLLFYDKLEKANLILEQLILRADKPYTDREIQAFLGNGPQADGGFFHYFKDLVNKYGICPKDAMGETEVTSHTSEMDSVLNRLMAKDAAIIQDTYKQTQDTNKLYELKEKFLEEIYRVLAICIGQPIEEFEYEYKEYVDGKEGKLKRIVTTPKDFYNDYVKSDLEDYVVLVNYPSQDYPFYQTYENKIAYNMAGQKTYKILNLPIEDVKEAAIKSLKDNNPMWFACDVSTDSYRKEGYLSTEVINLEELFNIDLNYKKIDKIKYFSSFCNHAMTLTGVNLVDEKPNRWKVQNSWGEDVGSKGIFTMTDNWFDEYVYEVVVKKEYLNKDALDALEKNVKTLEVFDPVA